MSIFSYIIWSPNPDIIDIGPLVIRWYGLLFALGFIIGQQIIYYIFKKEGKPEKDVETITIYMVIATIIGARLGHVLFYEPAQYLSDPIKILKIWEGGLASHGAAIGILTAIYLYSNYYINISFKEFKIRKRKRQGQGFLWVVDKIVIVVALAGALIRLGNFINSEIIGVETNSNNGVVFGWDAERIFEREVFIQDVEFSKPASDSLKASLPNATLMTMTFVERDFDENDVRNFIEEEVKNKINSDPYASQHIKAPQEMQYDLAKERGSYVATVVLQGIPRHPAQLYESFSSLLIFVLLFLYWRKTYRTLPDGRIFGIFLVVLFGLRFVYEFFKESQVAFEDELPLNMGQWLSIPLVIAGVIILVWTGKRKKKEQSA